MEFDVSVPDHCRFIYILFVCFSFKICDMIDSVNFYSKTLLQNVYTL